MRDAVREDVADRDFEGDREDVEAREHVFARRAARARDSAEIVRVQVDQVEDALLIELIGIVELAGDDPPAVRQRVDEGVDERLIVETHFTARGIPGVVTLEGTETVDEPIGLRAVVVRENGEIPAKDDRPRRPISYLVWSRCAGRSVRVTFMVSVPPVSCQSSSLPPPRGSRAGWASGVSLFLNSTR